MGQYVSGEQNEKTNITKPKSEVYKIYNFVEITMSMSP